MQRRREYYQELEKIGKGTGDLTDWLSWFISQFELAIDSACQRMDNVFLKTTFWNQHSEATLSSRQRKAVNLVLEAEPDGFIGGMSTGKYVAINKTSRATAYRELSDLVTKGIFETRGIGRGLRYQLKKTTKLID